MELLLLRLGISIIAHPQVQPSMKEIENKTKQSMYMYVPLFLCIYNLEIIIYVLM